MAKKNETNLKTKSNHDAQSSGSRGGSLFHAITSKLSNKLVMSMLLASLLPMLVLAVGLIYFAASSLKQRLSDQVIAVRAFASEQVRAQFDDWHQAAQLLASHPKMIDGIRDLRSSFNEMGTQNRIRSNDFIKYRGRIEEFMESRVTSYLRSQKLPAVKTEEYLKAVDEQAVAPLFFYTVSNPSPFDLKEQLNAASDQSNYTSFHRQFHPWAKEQSERFRFSDLLLVDEFSGRVIYSCRKDLDFATSLQHPLHADSNLAKCYQQARRLGRPGQVAFSDVSDRAVSIHRPAGVLGVPIFDGGVKLGILLVRFDVTSTLNRLEQAEFSNLANTHLIADDGLLRNGNDHLLQPIPAHLAPAFSLSQEGTAGFSNVFANSSGRPSFCAWNRVLVHPENGLGDKPVYWSLIVYVDPAKISGALSLVTLYAGTLILITLVGTAFIAFTLSKGLVRQTHAIMQMLRGLAKGEPSRIPIISHDELGSIAKTINDLCDTSFSIPRSRTEQTTFNQSIRALCDGMSAISSGDLGQEVKVTDRQLQPIVNAYAQMTINLRQQFARMQEFANYLDAETRNVQFSALALSDGANRQAKQVTTAKTSIADMAVSIQQVSKTAAQSADVAIEARQNAQRGFEAVQDTIGAMAQIREDVQNTSKRIKRLGESSQEIGEMVELISDLADQTSILALNASIQAEAAGEAGQGFARVAEEVEMLADQSNTASKRIASLVKSIQRETAEAISSMEESTGQVVKGTSLANQAGEALSVIAGFSDRQADLNKVIATAVRQQALGAEGISSNMQSVTSAGDTARENSKTALARLENLIEVTSALAATLQQIHLPARTLAATQPLDEEQLREDASVNVGL